MCWGVNTPILVGNAFKTLLSFKKGIQIVNRWKEKRGSLLASSTTCWSHKKGIPNAQKIGMLGNSTDATQHLILICFRFVLCGLDTHPHVVPLVHTGYDPVTFKLGVSETPHKDIFCADEQGNFRSLTALPDINTYIQQTSTGKD